MLTRRFDLDDHSLNEAALFLRQGKLVAFPTETVYGLGAPIFSPDTISKIFIVKKRPSDNPLIAHISSLAQVERIAVEIPKDFFLLAERFWPGPLTIVLKKHSSVPSIVSGGGSTIAFRMPNHKIALKLIDLVGEPLVAPSANLSGRPSSTTAYHVLEDFEGAIEGVIMGGACQVGLESTVISLLPETGPLLLRPGSITPDEIAEVLGKPVILATNTSSKAHSPGTRYRHYAPKGQILLMKSREDIEACLKTSSPLKRHVVYPTSQNLYAELRLADERGAQEILVLCDESVQRQDALMNRLSFAASKK